MRAVVVVIFVLIVKKQNKLGLSCPWVSFRAGTWLIDQCYIAFIMSFLILSNPDPLLLLLFSMSFVLPSSICLVSWIPRIPVLCSPASGEVELSSYFNIDHFAHPLKLSPIHLF